MNTGLILNYLTELSENNNREWYHLHKAQYKEAEAEFEELLQRLILEIGKTDNRILHNVPKELIFKLVRDTRFSHDKSPYNPAFRAHIAAQGKLPVPVGYYLMIKPGNNSFLGAAFLPICLKTQQGWYVIISRSIRMNWMKLLMRPSSKNILQ